MMHKHEKERQSYQIGSGASLMLLIFIAVMLLTLGLLSLLSARSSIRLTERRVEGAQTYYAADMEVAQQLHRLDAMLYALSVSSQDEDGFDTGLSALAEGLDWYQSEVNERVLMLQVPYAKDQYISVAVYVNRWGAEGERYTVLQRRTDMLPGWEEAYDSLLM